MVQNHKLLLILLFSILFIGYFGFNHVLPLRAEEPRRAIVGIESAIGENALVPTIHSEPYYNKPPVYNWILASSFILFGSFSEWVVRLPGVLSIWITAFLLFLFIKKYGKSEKAILGGMVFLTFGDLLFYGSVNAGEIDLFYTLLVFVQASSIFHFREKRAYWSLFLISYFIATIGLLTKGLPSLAFQALTLLGVFIWKKDSKLFSIQHCCGIALMFFLAGGYFYAYSKFGNTKGYLLNLWFESSSKSASISNFSDIIASLIEFPGQLITIMLPFSIFLVFLRKKHFKGNLLTQFSIVFLLSNIWLYWISPDPRNRYLYAFMPFFAILLAEVLVRVNDQEKFSFWLGTFTSILTIIIGVVFILIPFTDVTPEANTVLWGGTGGFILLTGVTQFRFRQIGLLHLMLTLGLLRLALNLCIMPIQAESSVSTYYKQQVSEILEKSGGEEIFWTGSQYKWEAEISFRANTLVSDSLETPPLIPYQVSYYYFKKMGSVLKYVENPLRDTWYLSREIDLPSEGVVEYHRFEDKWTQNTLVLFRMVKA